MRPQSRVPIAITTLVWYTGACRAVVGLECHEFVVQQLRKFPEHIQIGARRQAGVRHVMCTIQNDAAGPLEILCFGFAMRQIDGA